MNSESRMRASKTESDGDLEDGEKMLKKMKTLEFSM